MMKTMGDDDHEKGEPEGFEELSEEEQEELKKEFGEKGPNQGEERRSGSERREDKRFG